ncbi:serine/threonine-protein phosphatase (plasmid) [Deinococcus sp. KNUC1210]|uniref:PP2C family protein-serine/threonine phosphatase n=1 Tax=Deinococcus sp. KNUC1210 TaxID=2917691 RepID=UPI001EF0C81D|nr:PP2C family protein-serine/threonine phosphatase [Deinococcus sp. KNUC1210]ULH17754.1 serine/threonine-protein phosphatase [Deinococcus sp. KNUC1210]
MNDTLQALESTVAALADSYDQLVFLQHAVNRAVNATGLPDLLSLLHDAQALMEAGGSAMHVAGTWVGEVPDWLAAQQRPSFRAFEVAVSSDCAPAAFLGVPFGTDALEGGWLAFWDKAGAFSAGDARLAENLAALIASTLSALRTRQQQLQQELEEHDRQLATRIWRNLVSERLPAPAHYEVAVLSQPAAQVGGDFQFALGNWIMVGDVSGKGIGAALFTGMFVSSLRLAVLQEDVGAAIAVAVHAQLEAAEMLATLAVIHVQDDGSFRYLNMGHPPLLIRRADGSTELLKATAPPLGTFALPQYPMTLGRLAPGDLLCLYSDGVSEAQRTGPGGTLELFEVQGVEQTLMGAASPDHGLELLSQALQTWEIQDDLTVVLVQYRPEPLHRPAVPSASLAHPSPRFPR